MTSLKICFASWVVTNMVPELARSLGMWIELLLFGVLMFPIKECVDFLTRCPRHVVNPNQELVPHLLGDQFASCTNSDSVFHAFVCMGKLIDNCNWYIRVVVLVTPYCQVIAHWWGKTSVRLLLLIRQLGGPIHLLISLSQRVSCVIGAYLFSTFGSPIGAMSQNQIFRLSGPCHFMILVGDADQYSLLECVSRYYRNHKHSG